MKTYQIFILALLIFSAWILPVTPAFALTLSPVRIEIAGDPGQTLHGEIELYNEQSEQKTFFSSFENFEPSGEDGAPKFVGGGKELATWIETEESIVLAPNEKRKISYTITIPEGTEAGGYFGAIFFGGQNPSAVENGEVSVGGKLGTLILLTVRGDIEEGAGILDFGTNIGRIGVYLPVSFSFRMSNDGADRIVPVGDIRITNGLGMTVATIPANENEGSILPNSARRFTSVWEATGVPGAGFFDTVRYEWNNLHIGWYTAHARVAWGTHNTVSMARYDFFLIPWHLLIVCMCVGGVLAYSVRRYNAWIIRHARTTA